MFCLTENLQFFLNCNTVSYHITHDTVNLYGHQSYLSIQTPLSTIEALLSPGEYTCVHLRMPAAAFEMSCVCIQCCVGVFKMMEKVPLLTGDVLHYLTNVLRTQ